MKWIESAECIFIVGLVMAISGCVTVRETPQPCPGVQCLQVDKRLPSREPGTRFPSAIYSQAVSKGFSKAIDAYQRGNYEEAIRLLKREYRLTQRKVTAERKVLDGMLESMVCSMDRKEYEKMRREIETAREALDSKMVICEEAFR